MSHSVIPTSFIRFRDELESVFGDRFRQLILFGSYARGEARPESDVDVLLVLRDPFLESEVIPVVLPIVVRYLLETGLFFSVILKSESDVETQELGLMQNIKEEGVRL